MKPQKTTLPSILSKEELIEFSRIHPGRIIADIVICWVIILISFEVVLLTKSPVLFIPAFIMIGCMQNMLILWTHEASHYHFSRDKRRNDILGDLFVAGPTGQTIGQYRWQHLPHHLHLNDPEHDTNPLIWMCIQGGHLYFQLLNHMSGFYFLKILRRYTNYEEDPRRKNFPRRSPASLAGFAISHGIIFLLCVLQGGWYLYFLLWLAPLFTLAMLINNFRSLVEHQPSSDVCDTGVVKMYAMTRVIHANWLEQWLIAPVGFYFHYEHHLFPGIPCHRLAEVRSALTQRGHFNNPDIVHVNGYLRTIWQLAMQPGYGVRVLSPLFDPDGDYQGVGD